jgi:hypothetical protein
MKKFIVIENQIAGFLIGKKFYEALGIADFAPKDGKDEVHVLRRELHSTVRLNHFHRRSMTNH